MMMTKSKRRSVGRGLTAILVVMAACVVGLQDLRAQMVQRDIQAQLMLKITSLDRNFDRYGDPIKIGVTSEPMFSALERFNKQAIKGKTFTVTQINSLEEVSSYTIVYIDKNWKGNYQSVHDIAVEKKILMFVGEPEVVERGEAGIGFKTVMGNPKIVVHLEAVKQQGANFPANFLQMTILTGNI